MVAESFGPLLDAGLEARRFFNSYGDYLWLGLALIAVLAFAVPLWRATRKPPMAAPSPVQLEAFPKVVERRPIEKLPATPISGKTLLWFAAGATLLFALLFLVIWSTV